MKNKLFHYLVILLLISGDMVAQNIWTQKANFGGGNRYATFQFSIGDKGYVGTGYDGVTTYVYKSDFWEFNPSTGAWTQKADFAGGRRVYATGFSVGNKGYAGMGGAAYYDWRKDMWEYDPVSNTWRQLADFAGGFRQLMVGFGIGNKGYMGTGNYQSQGGPSLYYNDFWEYDPATDNWTQKRNVPGEGRYGAIGISIGNKGYIGTGGNNSTMQKDFYEYDPASDSWTRKADFAGNERYAAAAFSIGNKGYIGPGWGNSGFADFWEYTPSTDSWIEKATFPGGERNAGASFSIGNKGYIGIGGNSVGALNDFWEYSPTPQCEVWTQQPDLPQGDGRYGPVSVGIGNYGYVGLGAGNSGYLNDFWKFDPLTKIWTQVADFPGAARQAGVAFGIADKAYVGTGITSPYIVFNDLYEYTPSSNTWVKKADYPGGGRYTAMAFSIGDKGYVGAGKDNGFTYGTNDFYEYNPATDSWTKKADIGTVRRSGGVSFSIGNKGYMGMGFQDYDTRMKDLWEYNPATDTWVQKADLPASERYAPGAFTLGDKGFVCGGYNYSAFNDLWAYTPSTDSWEQKISIPYGGSTQGIGMNIGNKGYVGFGYGYNITYNTLWEYSTGLELKAPASQTLCYSNTNTYTIPLPELNAACSIVSSQFSITGATTRSGNGLNASGQFNPGISLIKWIVVDNSGNSLESQTQVRINTALSVSIPNTYPLLIWGEPNTLYQGFGPTNVTLFAVATGGTKLQGNKYSYLWSNGATTPYINVMPGAAGAYNYTVTVTDSFGCSVIATRTINVIDVRCGQALNKVIICRPDKHGNNEFCVNQNQAIIALLMGAHLGNCSVATAPNTTFGNKMEENTTQKLAVFPNPNNGTFTVTLTNIDATEVRVVDQNGKIITRKKTMGTVKTNTLSFQLPTVAKGMYMIQAISKEGIFTCKMMVQQ